MLTTPTDPQTISTTANPAFVTLSDIKTGEKARVISLNGGRGLICRMAALGFTPGVEVMVIQNSGRGPLIASVRGTRVALGRQEARKTIVQVGP